MSNISKYTNVFLDGEVLGYNPDGDGDYFKITDYGRDFTYLQEKIAYAVRGLMGQSDQDFVILYGGEVTDSGGGQVDISEGLAIGKDSDSNLRFVPIPALSNVPIPSGWNDGRQIWVVGEHLFKLSTDTRNHKQTSTSYHYTVEDSYLGETDSDDLFVAADPGGSQVIWGSFTMTGTTFASLDAGERSNGNLILNQKLALGYDTSGNAIINNTENTDLILSTNNTARMYVKNNGVVQIPAILTENKVFSIGTGRSGDGDCFFYLVGDATYTDYGFRIRRYGGANVGSLIESRGTGNLQIKTAEAGAIDFYTAGTFAVRIKNNGYFGIGVDPSNPLHIQSTATPQVRIAYDGSNYVTFSCNSASSLYVDSEGLFLTNDGSASFVQGRTGSYLRMYESADTDYIQINHNGTNGIITTSAGNVVISGTNLVADTGNIVATAGNLQCGANLVVTGNYTQPLKVTDATESTTKDTGCAIFEGGLGVEKRINAGLAIASATTITAGTGITATTGNIVATAGNINIVAGELQHNGNPVAGYLDDGTPYYKKIIDIGDWDMVTTPNVSIAHGLTYTNIISIYVNIIRDDSVRIYDFTSNNGGTVYSTSTNIELYRTTGGLFDTTNYNSTSFNRGSIEIEYK